MIIYPSESFAKGQELSKKKLNTYFELTTQQSNVVDSIFSENGVQVFVDEASNTTKYTYNVLPLIEFLCFEIFKAENSVFNLKALIVQWQEYVQAARSHTSLFAGHCYWQKFNMQMTQEQRDLYIDLESLLLNDELRELDNIVRACCGAEVNKDGNKVSELQIAEKLAQSVSALKKEKEKLQDYKNCEIEKAVLEVKCEKLIADVQTNESIATKKHALLQTSRKEAEELSEKLNSLREELNAELADKERNISTLKCNESQLNQHLAKLKEEIATLQNVNLKQAEELDTLLNEKHVSENQLKQDFKEQRQELESKLDNIVKQKDRHIEVLKGEAELSQLQIIQLQEELETLFITKQDYEVKISSFKEKIANSSRTDEGAFENMQAENELMRLQIIQLQEELEFYFEKASEKSQEDATQPRINEEKQMGSSARALLENHNTLSLINRLVMVKGRE